MDIQGGRQHPGKLKPAEGMTLALAARYRAGLTLRQIGAEIGRSHTAVRYQLRKLPGYRAMVTHILKDRLRSAQGAFSITPTREHGRRLKHALAMLRQKRPAIYARMLDRTRPRQCTTCGSAVTPRPLADMWLWECGYCGDRGIAAHFRHTRRDSMAAKRGRAQHSRKPPSL